MKIDNCLGFKFVFGVNFEHQKEVSTVRNRESFGAQGSTT